MVAVIALLGAVTPKLPEEIRAKRFVVVDDGETKRVELGKLEGPGTGLALYDSKGNIRVRLLVLPYIKPSTPSSRIEEEAWMQLYDPETYGRILLHVNNDDGPELRLSAVLGPNASLGVSPKTGPYFRAYTGDGGTIWKAP